MPRTKYPIPAGWRRLRTGAIIREGDMMNAMSNWANWFDRQTDLERGGWIAAYVGTRVSSTDVLIYIRPIR